MIGERCGLMRVEAAQLKGSDAGTPVPGRLKFWPERDDQQHRQRPEPYDQPVHQLERAWIGPMRVFEQQEHGGPPRPFAENSVQGFEGPFLLALRAESQRRVSLSTRDAEHLGDERHLLWGAAKGAQKGLELVELCTSRLAAHDASLVLPT